MQLTVSKFYSMLLVRAKCATLSKFHIVIFIFVSRLTIIQWG